MKKLALLVCALCIPLVQAAPPKGDAAKGKTFFEANCSGCHGEAAAGGIGPKLAGKLQKWTFAGFKKTLKENVTPDRRTLKPPMMKFNFSDQEFADLLSYLKSLK
ncbi:c-type cytochrome [Deinococcus cellulosilyticus]|uniref:Cytochrome c domain-containing protein n=1 Tax=Deinococcus cellulosilyticus (strain DSM 18568 / NBRC 106333 / KACC 11606 / 5516J-15) TaxID=1223518 RepID=A0A511N6K6_DEIC1|nr:cytochrome c [Deinococcus cellulosilyticus]GEM48475.1 hypothetical protein DC3_41100 [Deinococcus cellulosilyticus NBRC 106333 = KACC 11606]